MGTVRVDVDTAGPERMIRSAVDAMSQPDISYAVRDAAEVFQRGIASRAPRRSGRLAGSFEIRSVSAHEYEVSSDLVYARPQEEGAFIKPRNRGGVLAFRSGGPRFLKWVRVRPQPYVAPTFVADADEAFDAFADRVDRSLRG